MMKFIQPFLILVLLCTFHTVKADPADIVYINAKIYTVNERQPWAEAMAIEGNRIVAVGDESTVKSYIDRGAQVVDVKGKLILPGLVEEHVHPDMAAENLMNIHLLPSKMSWQQQKEKILTFAKSNPGSGWLMGGGVKLAARQWRGYQRFGRSFSLLYPG